jgi:hypothetical protein
MICIFLHICVKTKFLLVTAKCFAAMASVLVINVASGMLVPVSLLQNFLEASSVFR